MAEYGSMLLVACLATILFFGGWNGPIPIFEAFAYGPGETGWKFGGFVANLAGCVNFIIKAYIGVTVMIWVRWTLPRLRIDQVMTTCLKYCTPIAAARFAGVMLWQLFLPGGLVAGSFQNAAGVREGWLEQSNNQEPVNEDSLSNIVPSRRIVEVSQ